MPGLLRVALTGGIATGKSHCLSQFAAHGLPTLDADVLAHEAVEPNSPGLSKVVDRFGPAVVTADGTLDRAALGRIVFGDPAARRDLEAIVHPIVYAGIARNIASLEEKGKGQRAEGKGQKEGKASAVVVDIPLLYETGREGDFDRVVVTWCPLQVQMARLIHRGLSETEARQRLASQWPTDAKARRADHVIDTSGSVEETDRQVRTIADLLNRPSA